MPQTHREVIPWPIDRLREHPRQREMFSEHPPDRFQAFVEDLRENGQRDPVEIKPDGTILDGHHRAKAGRQLGWSTIDVVVLHEFADAGETAELQYMFNRNTQRRQMTELDLARAFRTMKLAMGKASSGEMRDEIAALLGYPKKGRTFERLEKVLDMPPAIQTAFSRGTLAKTIVYKISALPPKDQQEIADRLERGEDPDDVVGTYRTLRKHKVEDTPQDLYFVFMDFLKGNVQTLDENCDEIVGKAMDYERAAEVLARTRVFCEQMEDKEITAHKAAVSHMRGHVFAKLSPD